MNGARFRRHGMIAAVVAGIGCAYAAWTLMPAALLPMTDLHGQIIRAETDVSSTEQADASASRGLQWPFTLHESATSDDPAPRAASGTLFTQDANACGCATVQCPALYACVCQSDLPVCTPAT